jgi:hypothetical protein
VQPIRLMRDEDELKTTAVFEFQPGPWLGSFRDGVYVDMEVFDYITPIIWRTVPGFDYAGPTAIPAQQALELAAALDTLAGAARTSRSTDSLRAAGATFVTPHAETEFQQAFRENADALAGFAEDLAQWLRAELDHYDEIVLLGV